LLGELSIYLFGILRTRLDCALEGDPGTLTGLRLGVTGADIFDSAGVPICNLFNFINYRQDPNTLTAFAIAQSSITFARYGCGNKVVSKIQNTG